MPSSSLALAKAPVLEMPPRSHVWEDQYIIEIIDPKTGEPVADGEEGELVFTSLTREALPMIRFRTADLTRIISREGCDCGQTHLKIAPITGRRDDMLIVKGANFNVEAGPGVTGYMVEKALKETLGFSPKGDVFLLGGLPRQDGKAKRVFHKQIK